MSTKDLANNIKSFQLLKPVVNTSNAATVNSAEHDTATTQGIMLQVCVGTSADTLSGSLKYDFALQHSDVSGSGFANVTSASDVTYGTVDANGIFATVDDGAEDDANYQIGYAGGKRYVRVNIIAAGNHSSGTPLAINALTRKIHLPESGGNDGTPTGH